MLEQKKQDNVAKQFAERLENYDKDGSVVDMQFKEKLKLEHKIKLSQKQVQDLEGQIRIMEQEENTIMHISEEVQIQDDVKAAAEEKQRLLLAGGALSKKELKKYKFLKE